MRKPIVFTMVVAVLSAACAVATPSNTPSPAQTPGATPYDSPSAPPIEPTAANETASPAPIVPTMPPIMDGWRSVSNQASVRRDQFSDVVWTGQRFVALGSSSVIDSVDGLTWHRQAGYRGDRLAAGPRGLVQISWAGGLDSWVSADGLTWTVSKNAFAVSGAGPEPIRVSAVVPTDAGWLAVGGQATGCFTACSPQAVRALVWTSGDGLHWSRVADQPSFRKAAMTGVARGGPGYVAVGYSGNHGAVWTSSDGQAWSRVPDTSVFHTPASIDQDLPATIEDVASNQGTIVAVGNVLSQAEGHTALAWWSTGGEQWSRGAGDRFRPGQMNSVSPILGGFLAAGWGGQKCVSVSWWSSDGRSWECIRGSQFRDFVPSAAAASPDLVVVVGLGGQGEARDGRIFGAIWVKPLS